MNYLNILLNSTAVIIFAALFFQAAYLLIFSAAGRIIPLKKVSKSSNLGRFVIYIPSYKEDSVIIDTARAALAINYPTDKRRIVVIADSLQPDTLRQLRAMPISVIEVFFEKSTKAKALNVALLQTGSDYDYALILDADNVCEKDYLYRMNDVLRSGYKVVQGQRVAKNTNTTFALLDALSEGINNHIFRKGHRALGLSCAIIGSGMALDFELFETIMPEITAVGGFDKEMELRLLKRRISFAYAEKAIVYDEKTSHQNTFENQRRRWLSAQVHYMKRYLAQGIIQLLGGNIDFFDKVVQTLLLPRILMLGITPIFFLLSFLPGNLIPDVCWLSVVVITYVAILIAVPVKFVNRKLFVALLRLPSVFFSVFKLLFNLKGANKSFIHTPHGIR